ncbi:hypothetical protein DL764_005292 [Monosporascus ibericus]|uniref:Uncharacterized protein n=1 Tax=Monosporascus ibericus TaxID=155417 RepID=A0A4Q4T9J6_9PEZI|nr:hypothetical protein DL764_005292 [Monosporascus ibericus]
MRTITRRLASGRILLAPSSPRLLLYTAVLSRPLSTTHVRTASRENEYGQGVSHATGKSKVPETMQKAAPKALEDALPDFIHPTGKDPGQSMNKAHAKDGGEASVVPKKVQEKLPEGAERAVPNTLHDTGDK